MSDPPFTVKALFEYASEHDDDLHFHLGQVITVTAVEDADWFYGEYVDDSGSKQEGIFPRNFVERYEPTAPPRPSRPVKAKKEADPTPAPARQAVEPPASKEVVENEPAHEDEPEPVVATKPPQEKSAPLPPPPAVTADPVVPPATSQPPKQSNAAPSPAAKAPPPVVSNKPSSNAFRDRIAAFNKPAAPPIAPFKPGGASTTSFIKKPFVAPPPSKNAYVPIPREQPAPKVYRREEEPEFVNREPPVSEESQPAPAAAEPTQDEDQPKPTSLKERIALLQRQQLEQASRLAEAAQKKEKAKKPPKKRSDAQEAPPVPPAAAETSELERPSLEGERSQEYKAPQLASPPQPARELMSDTNDADYSGAADTEDAEETSTSREDFEERPRAELVAKQEQPIDDDNTDDKLEEGGEEEGEEKGDAEEEEEEEDDVDPEVRRKMELRERMAKMSGGMGMMGMFGAMPGMHGQPGPKKTKNAEDVGAARRSEVTEATSPPAQAPPVPIMALPGMNTQRTPLASPRAVEKEDEHEHVPITQMHPPEEVPDIEDVTEERGTAPRKSIDRAPLPPPLQERSVPPPLPTESRPPPPPVPGAQSAPPPPVPESRPLPPPPGPPMSPSPGSESDDELSVHTMNMSLNTALAQGSAPDAPPPPPRRSSTYDSLRSPTASEKRFSRGPPPIPSNIPPTPSSPPQGRPPPPPPPGVLSRQGTSDTSYSMRSPIHTNEDIQDETTEYEADYDTDIAPTAKHKDALKSHERDSSIDDAGDEMSPQSPRAPPEGRLPPPPPTTAPRAVPPPPPSQPPNKRASMDIPRSAPPPPPPARDFAAEEEDNEGDSDDYDPYKYESSGRPSIPPLPSKPPPPPREEDEEDEEDDSAGFQPQAPPPPPPERAAVAPPPPPPVNEAPRPRQSLDVSRGPLANTRRSMDIPRPSLDMGFIATDVDLAENTFWWTQPNIPPPVFQNRKDLLYEVEESSSSKRGGKTMVHKDVYVLFADYSQTIINARFDAKNPADITFEQRHEPPPNKLRQDQLEAAHERFGSRISSAINAVQNTTVGDGTAHGLIQHLLSPLRDVLSPIGTRAYGALVYANLANASIQQNDEIRAGDIISFRNARFQGHRGGLHQKYSAEVGKPDHVGVIVDWDGTKKKIHAWEQGRESKKVKTESFRLGDLKSGEVKVWRLMPRSWIGWDDEKQQ